MVSIKEASKRERDKIKKWPWYRLATTFPGVRKDYGRRIKR